MLLPYIIGNIGKITKNFLSMHLPAGPAPLPLLRSFSGKVGWALLRPVLYFPILRLVTQVPARLRRILSPNIFNPLVLAYRNALLYSGHSSSCEALGARIDWGAFVLLLGVLIFERFRRCSTVKPKVHDVGFLQFSAGCSNRCCRSRA
jgi:hypothetical protein